MRVRFWGTRGSIPAPGPDTARFGGNTSCVEVRTAADDLFILDSGTGIRLLGMDLLRGARPPARGHLLLGHTHWDHIQGFPFFRPIFLPGNEFDIYGPRHSQHPLHEALAGQMEFTYFPVELAQLPARIRYHELAPGAHEIGGVRVFAQYLHHPALTLGYRLEADGVAVVYLADHEPYADTIWRSDGVPGRLDSILHEGDRRHAHFMLDADLVIHDAQYTPEEMPARRTWGHSAYDYVVELAAAAGVRRLALTHHDPNRDDAALDEIERRARALAATLGAATEVFCAYEGGVVNLAPGAAHRPFTIDSAPLASATDRLRVLIVDDDPDVRRLASRALTRDGHTVMEAGNGREALEMVDRLRPDFVVLDLDIPEIDGFGVLKALRARPETAQLPVLILTVKSDASSTGAGFAVGATDYLAKPFSIPQLAARVRACLARAAAR
jgi:CheY-like chemotaxis protein/phosphoribosyl 1,2-cyclic phosphodiesterase